MTKDLHQYTDNLRHKVQLILLAETGMSLQKLTALQWIDFDLKNKTLKATTKENNAIALSETAYQLLFQLAEKQPPQHPTDFLFTRKGKPVSRQAVFQMIQQIQLKANQPALIPSTTKQKTKTSLLGRLKTWLFPVSLPHISIPSEKKEASFVGRETEAKRITELLSEKVSVIITGPVGIGKTALLENVSQQYLSHLPPNPSGKAGGGILVIDDCAAFKKSIANILLYLYEGDKESLMKLFFSVDSKDKLSAKVSKESLPNLCKTLCSLTDKHEYILSIGDIDRITPTAVKALEILSPHFVILSSAREVKLKNTTFLWHFEKVELKPLTRFHTLELARKLTAGFEMQDETYLMSRIWDISEGNPKMIVELCDRFSRESPITTESIERIASGYLGKQTKEIDMSIAFLLLFGALTIFRFAAAEVGNPSLRFIGGIFIVVLLFARPFLSAFKRKNL